MRAERRNISITNEKVSEFLDRQQNVSKFIENLIIEHIEDKQIEFATKGELEAIREEIERDIQILNKNFSNTKSVLEQVAKYISGGNE